MAFGTSILSIDIARGRKKDYKTREIAEYCLFGDGKPISFCYLPGRFPLMAMKKKAVKKSAAKKKAPAKKKTVAKKKVVAKKKAAARRKAVAPERKLTAIKERYTKTQVLNELAENTDLSKKQVTAVLDELAVLIERHIKPRACGEFTLPGLLKVKTVKKPARKARKNVPNPFRPGELMDVAAKPASIKVKVLPLTKLKGMASK